MTIVPRDPDREHRIHYETVADAYNEEERVMGWYYYLQDSPLFPFEATEDMFTIAPLVFFSSKAAALEQ